MALSTEQKLVILFGYSSVFFNTIVISIPSPFLPHENELHGLETTTTGLMLGILPFIQCLFTSFWAKLIIWFGVHNILVGGMFIASLTTGLFGTIQFIPPEKTIIYCTCGFAARILQGIGTSAIFVSAMTFIAEMFPKNSTLVLSILGSIGGVGMVSGPAIGGGLYKLGGFWLVFAGTGGVMFLLVIAMLFWLPSCESAVEDGPESSIPYRKILLDGRMIISLVIASFSAAKWSCIDPILEPKLRNTYGLPQEKSALMFLLLSGTYIIATPIAGKTIGQPYGVDSLMVMAIGLVVSAVTFSFAGPSPLLGIDYESLWLLMLCLSLMGLTNCLLYVPAQDIIFNIERLDLPPSTNRTAVRGVISGLWNTFYALGTSLGMVIAGAVAQFSGWAWTMTAFSITSLVFTIVVLVFRCREIYTINYGEGGRKKGHYKLLDSESPKTVEVNGITARLCPDSKEMTTD